MQSNDDNGLIDNHRRRFLGAAATVFAGSHFVGVGSAHAGQVADPAAREVAATSAFAVTKQIVAGVLNVSYAEAGPSDGPAVILLHGWPYDIHCYTEVASILAEDGYRVIVPYLRGYGGTRFLSEKTLRNAQQSVLAVDVIELMNALKIEQAIIGGCDWGARTANIVAALWPERCRAMVSVSYAGIWVTRLIKRRSVASIR